MLTLLGFTTLLLLAIGGWQAFGLVRQSLEAHRIEKGRELGLQARKLDLEERAIAVQEQKAKNPAVPTSIPPDLYRRIAQWLDPDAQDAERKVLLDLYQEFRDAPDPWVEVRNHLPRQPDETMPAELFTGMVQ